MAVYKSNKPTKDGRVWYFKVYKKNSLGKNVAYKSKLYLTKKEASEVERLFLIKRDNPVHVNFNLVATDYFNEIKKLKKDSTYESYVMNYKKHLEPFFGKYDIDNINIQIIKQWHLDFEKNNLSVAFMNKVNGILKKILDFAMINYGLTINYATIVGTFKEKSGIIKPDSKKIRYITIEEFNKFISVIDDPLWRTFFITALYTGCRKGELLALNWKSIDFNNNVIYIDKTLYTKLKGRFVINSTKNNKNRKIQMNKVLRDTLLEYKNYCKKYTDYNDNWYVFGNTSYLPLTTIDRYKHKYFELSGVKEITMHEFRHSCVSILINEYIKTSKEKNVKIDITKFFLILSERMGHSVEVMKNTYMHLFPSIQDEIVDLFDNL